MKDLIYEVVKKTMNGYFDRTFFEELYDQEIALDEYDSMIERGRRSETGSFYTPVKVTRFHLGVCTNSYIYDPKHLYLDPSVGSGNYVIELLKSFHEQGIDIVHVLNTQLWMVDIQATSMMAALLNILTHLHTWGVDIATIKPQVVVDNFLTTNILDDLAFDIIIANPPYIGEKGNTEVFDVIKRSDFGSRYYQGKMDCYGYFFFRGMELLSDKGRLSYIVPNYIYTSDSCIGLRKKIIDEMWVESLVDFKELKVFPNATGIHSAILTLVKSQAGKTNISFVEGKVKKKDFHQHSIKHFLQTDIVENHEFYINGNFVVGCDNKTRKILSWIVNQPTTTLESYFDVNQGFVSGCDRLSKKDRESLGFTEDKSVFVIDQSEYEMFKDQEYTKPIIKNSQIEDVFLSSWDIKYYILYSVDGKVNEHLVNHLKPFKEVLDRRREVKNGRRQWYEMTWPREVPVFEDEKILVPQRATKPYFCYHKGIAYGSADIYYIRLKYTLDQCWTLKAFVAYLYSDIVRTWLEFVGKRKGEMFELYATPLKTIPVLSLPHQAIMKLEKLTDDFSNEVMNLKEYQKKVNNVLKNNFGELSTLLEE